MARELSDIVDKIAALDLWSAIAPYCFAIKPRGTVFPYFCITIPVKDSVVDVRFLLLEGWQTFHDFVRGRVDSNFGVFQSPVEMPHYELVLARDGTRAVLRHDVGFLPEIVKAPRTDFVAKLLWEVYGVLLRIENDSQLPLKFVSEQAVFSRVEGNDGVWCDMPLTIPAAPPYVERISIPKDDLRRAKDVPFVQRDVLHVNFSLLTNRATKDLRPRFVYNLLAYDPATKTCPIDLTASVTQDGSLLALWEQMPCRFLQAMIERGRIPGEIKVPNGRMFRFLRPLCMELPFKLSLHDELEFSNRNV